MALRNIQLFIGEQYTSLPYPETKHTGQTVIVTGSNVGLGLEAARHFTRLEQMSLKCGSWTSLAMSLSSNS